jgi:hypothetical protein
MKRWGLEYIPAKGWEGENEHEPEPEHEAGETEVVLPPVSLDPIAFIYDR